jgi:precorrin-8X/cobalt-precorrin-8 methylmutase
LKPQLERILPTDIEKRSFEIIESELPKPLNPLHAPIIKRVIHTTADFDYTDTLCFSNDAVKQAQLALKNGACIVTDTNMAKAGINQAVLKSYSGDVYCFMADQDVAESAKKNGTTRAVACMEKACGLNKPLIFAIGNAPTALVRLYELIQEGRIQPKLVIGVRSQGR